MPGTSAWPGATKISSRCLEASTGALPRHGTSLPLYAAYVFHASSASSHASTCWGRLVSMSGCSLLITTRVRAGGLRGCFTTGLWRLVSGDHVLRGLHPCLACFGTSGAPPALPPYHWTGVCGSRRAAVGVCSVALSFFSVALRPVPVSALDRELGACTASVDAGVGAGGDAPYRGFSLAERTACSEMYGRGCGSKSASGFSDLLRVMPEH